MDDFFNMRELVTRINTDKRIPADKKPISWDRIKKATAYGVAPIYGNGQFSEASVDGLVAFFLKSNEKPKEFKPRSQYDVK